MADIPAKSPALSPHLVCDGASDAIAFYELAFGAEEVMRLPGADGRLMHGAIVINGATVMLTDENAAYGNVGPKTLGGTPVTLHLGVDNADAAIDRAAKAGATVKMPATDMFWGERYGIVVDPWGHVWSMSHPLRDQPMTEAELREAGKDAACGAPTEA